MSDLIDKLVEGAGQVISDVDKGGRIQTAISGLRHQMAEADRKRRINNVKKELSDLQAREAQTINALSAQVLALYEAGTLTQPELRSLCKGVDEVRVQIKTKEAELELLLPAPPPAPAEPAPSQQPSTGSAPGALCPTCGVAVVEGAAFCQTCGTQMVQEEPPPLVHFCPHCGAQLRPGARFCPKCGQTMPGPQGESAAP